ARGKRKREARSASSSRDRFSVGSEPHGGAAISRGLPAVQRLGCVNLRRVFRELLVRSAHSFHLDCYIDGGGAVRCTSLQGAGRARIYGQRDATARSLSQLLRSY